MEQIGNISLAIAAIVINSFFVWKLSIIYLKKGFKGLKWDEWAYFVLFGMSMAAYNHFFEYIIADFSSTTDWIARFGSAILLIIIWRIIYLRAKSEVAQSSKKNELKTV